MIWLHQRYNWLVINHQSTLLCFDLQAKTRRWCIATEPISRGIFVGDWFVYCAVGDVKTPQMEVTMVRMGDAAQRKMLLHGGWMYTWGAHILVVCGQPDRWWTKFYKKSTEPIFWMEYILDGRVVGSRGYTTVADLMDEEYGELEHDFDYGLPFIWTTTFGPPLSYHIPGCGFFVCDFLFGSKTRETEEENQNDERTIQAYEGEDKIEVNTHTNGVTIHRNGVCVYTRYSEDIYTMTIADYAIMVDKHYIDVWRLKDMVSVFSVKDPFMVDPSSYCVPGKIQNSPITKWGFRPYL